MISGDRSASARPIIPRFGVARRSLLTLSESEGGAEFQRRLPESCGR